MNEEERKDKRLGDMLGSLRAEILTPVQTRWIRLLYTGDAVVSCGFVSAYDTRPPAYHLWSSAAGSFYASSPAELRQALIHAFWRD